VKPRYLRILAATLLLNAIPATVIAAEDGVAALPFRFYSVADGLTQSEVRDMEQDKAGYLWFTTARGLNRYDGREFENFTIADGLPVNALTALEIDADNAIWIGDERGGITVIRNGQVTETIAPLGDSDSAIVDIEVVDGEVVAIADGIGILHVVGQPGSAVFKRIAGEWAHARNLVEWNGKFLFVADDGAYTLELEPRPAIFPISRDITLLHADDGDLWAVNRDKQLGRYTEMDFEFVAELPARRTLISLSSDSLGTVWASSDTELFAVHGAGPRWNVGGTSVRTYPGFDELSNIYVDHERTLWASSGSRLVRFLGDRFQHYRLQTGPDPETIWAITEDPQGRLWFGTRNNVVVRNADESLTLLGPRNGLPTGSVRDLVAGPDGIIWAGIRGEGVYRVSAESLRGEIIEGTEGLSVLDLAHDPRGFLWLATEGAGVFRYDLSALRLDRYPSPDNSPVYSLDLAADGSVWYGADDHGLVHLTPLANGESEQEIFGEEQGLGHLLFGHIRVVGQGRAWVATEEGGLYSFDDGRFEKFGGGTSHWDQSVYLVEELRNGTVVVGGERGLYQFVPGEGRTVHYNQMSGFLALETNAHATFFDSAGWLWIGTVDGASRMDVSLPMPAEVELTPQIVSMTTLAGNEVIPDGGEVESSEAGLSIEFAAVSLLNPRDVELSYSLEGVDDAWGAPTTNRMVDYTRIPPGSHRFMVRARYPGGEWSEAIAGRSFTVRPFFWQRPIFIVTALIAMILAIRTAMIYRTRNIERMNEMLKAQVTERTKSIEEAKHHLQVSHERLSREVEERRKADEARNELEMRFRKAFENAPIGMGLLDAEGRLFDANPALSLMLWASNVLDDRPYMTEVIVEEDRNRFKDRYGQLVGGGIDTINERFDCESVSGQILKTEVNISPVHAGDEEFSYSVVQVQDLTEAITLTDQLEYQARYDELTGLYNRRAFEAELERAWNFSREREQHSFLLYMDLDQFKVVNDTSGHAAGDKLLQQLSDILLANVRSNDTVGRMGGDEFAIILWKCPREVAERIAESIRAEIEAFRFHWDTETYKVGVSVGGVALDSRLGDISEIQQLADTACFTAKEDGRNRVHMVEGEKDSACAHRKQIRWVQRLREAMDNNRFAIYAQRIKPFDETPGEPPRYEVLLRLRDPETRRLIPPGAFLPAAERYGLSVELDEWVVRNLLHALFLFQSFAAEHRRYWINLSGLSIGEKRFATFLRKAVTESPLPPGTINFEITETAVIRNVAEAGHLIGELRDMGCEFALDDFGSGLSSFGYLKKLPVSSLKIDGMFIRNIVADKTDRIFVKSIIDIAHTLDIKTTCELIENEEMLEVVRDLGADYAQGFAVERPFELAPRFPGKASPDSGAGQQQRIAG
jgi:diguanylate cyclase (GGDEF)-like protein/PAS domain S-box-containing protein